METQTGLEEYVLPPRLGLNLVQDEGEVLGQVTQSNGLKSIASSCLNFLTGVLERSKDGWLELSQLAQISSTASLSNSKQAGEAPHVLLHHSHGLPLAVADQTGHALGNVSPTLLVDGPSLPPHDRVNQDGL